MSIISALVNIALDPPLCIDLLYQKSYLITEHIQQVQITGADHLN